MAAPKITGGRYIGFACTFAKITIRSSTIKTDSKAIYCLLGLENQQLIHYAAPVKVALYDLMNLAGQVAEAAR